jgi:hypothetical protein
MAAVAKLEAGVIAKRTWDALAANPWCALPEIGTVLWQPELRSA